MTTYLSVTHAQEAAALQHLHQLAKERYYKLIDELIRLEEQDEQSPRLADLHADRRHQHAFVLELNRMLYAAGVDPLL